MDTQFSNLLKDAFKLAAKIVHNTADAHDVIQDSAAIAFSHASAPESTSVEFKPWFYRVVRNKSIDRVRANQVALKRHDNDANKVIEQTSAHIGNAEANPETEILRTRRQQNIAKALDNISLEHREIVMLKDFHGFSYAEIADILSIAKGSVMSRLHRARLALKNELAALDITSAK
jgi:RNA polymerase sigma-70 factor (ECF subfamily)